MHRLCIVSRARRVSTAEAISPLALGIKLVSAPTRATSELPQLRMPTRPFLFDEMDSIFRVHKLMLPTTHGIHSDRLRIIISVRFLLGAQAVVNITIASVRCRTGVHTVPSLKIVHSGAAHSASLLDAACRH